MPATGQSETKYRIRIAAEPDITQLIPVVNAAFAIEIFLEGVRTDEDRLRAMMQKGELLLAEDQSGCVLASVYVEQRSERGYFGMLAVDPSQQGKGLGRTMVEAAEDYCREQGCKFMDITVLNLRPELPPFYRKLGYVETGIEEFQSSRGLKDGAKCHSIVMSKEL